MNEILKIQEVEALPRSAEQTVYSIARQNEPPAFRAQWRVRRADLKAWTPDRLRATRPEKT